MKNKNYNDSETADIYDFQKRVTFYFGALFVVLMLISSSFILNSMSTAYNDVAVDETIATTERIQKYIRDGNSPDEAAVSGFLNDRNIDFRIINHVTGAIVKSNFDNNTPFSGVSNYITVGKEKKVSGDPAAKTREVYKDGKKYVVAERVMYYHNEKYTIEAAKAVELDASYYKSLFIRTAVVDVAGILAVIYLSKYLCRIILVPIEKITSMAENISVDDLSRRIPEEGDDGGLKSLISTLNSMIARLEVSFKKQSQFVSDASHELKTPIAVINGYINLMDRWGKERPEVMQEGIDSIKAETENMNVLIKKLLFLAKHENASGFNKFTAVSAQEVLNEVYKEFNIIHQDRKAVFNCQTNCMLYADFNAIKQLLWIYADNAYKYTKDHNTVTFSTYNDDKYVYLAIEDDGGGISKDDIPFLFDRFYRVDKSRNKGIGGTGLGLAIAKKLVESLNGEVYVESEPNVRTAFINKFKIYKP